MSIAGLINRYVWFVTTIYNRGPISLADLQHTQIEVERNDKFSIFEYRLCPSFDFRQKILSMGATTEVLAPAKLIAKVRAEGITEQAQPNVEYKFKVYKR